MNSKSNIFRSSQRRCSVKKGVLRNFTKFIGKHLCRSLFFDKVAGLRPATLLKKRLWQSCFPVNLRNFSEHLFNRTPLDNCFYISHREFCTKVSCYWHDKNIAEK